MIKALSGAAGCVALLAAAWPVRAQPQTCPPGYACPPPAYGQAYAPRYPSQADRPPAPPPLYNQPLLPAVPYQHGPWENSAHSYQMGTQ